MAHWEQSEFIRLVKEAYPDQFQNQRVLEVGSGEIRGTVRSQFERCDYTGVDVTEGPGVDRACPGQMVDDASESYDVVISCECFEHNPYWLETFVNMLRLLKPGGIFIMSCALTGRQEHGTSRMDPRATLAESADYKDYYRNLTRRSFTRSIDMELHFAGHFFQHNIYHKDLYFVGIKHGKAAQQHTTHLADLSAKVREVRSEKPRSAVAAHINYGIKFGLAAVLGEDRFHDAKYAARSGLAKLLELIVGKERVRQYRENKRKEKQRKKGLS